MGKVTKEASHTHLVDPMLDTRSAVTSTPTALQSGHVLGGRTGRGGTSTAGRQQLPAAQSPASFGIPGAWPGQIGGAGDHPAPMPFPMNQDIGFHALVEHPAIDHLPLPEHDPRWGVQHGAGLIAGFTQQQLEHSFHSAFRRAEDATGKVLLQHRPLPQGLQTTSGSVASTGLMPGANVTPRPAAASNPTATVQRRVDVPANLLLMLANFRAKVVTTTHDQATAEEYVKTIRTMILWSFNAGQKFGTDNQADTNELLRKFRAHVGANSHAGRNAGSALQALRTATVTKAPARQTTGEVDNPLGFDGDELAVIVKTPGGPSALVHANANWPALTEWLSHDQLFSIMSKKNARPALKALEKFGAALMKPSSQGGLGVSVEQLVDIAKGEGGGPGIDALSTFGPGLAKPVSEGGLGMSADQLVMVAERGGSPPLKALAEVGTTLVLMGVSTESMTTLGADTGRGRFIRAVASRLLEVHAGGAALDPLAAAGLQTSGGLETVNSLGH